jgi:hypothetical protein
MAVHQPDQASFKSVLPDAIDWKPFRRFRRRPVWQSSSESPPSRGRT